MPCQSFLANGIETNLKKQSPLCDEEKSPPAYFFSSLVAVLWKQSKNGLCHRRGCRDGMNTQGWCMGWTHAPLCPCSCKLSPGRALAIGTEQMASSPALPHQRGLRAGHAWFICIRFHSIWFYSRQGIKINLTAAPRENRANPQLGPSSAVNRCNWSR